LEQAVALAQTQNRDIAIARKKLQAARGGVIEARSGYLPSVVSSGIYRKREQQEATRLRSDDYNASLRVVQNIYTGGAISSQTAIARLNYEKQEEELRAVIDRVTMDVRVAFNELLMDRAKVKVHEQALGVLREELKTQRERLSAGTVGELNVRRAEVALANEEPELIGAQTQLRLSYLRLGELFGIDSRTNPAGSSFEIAGQLQYQPRHPDLNDCLTRAILNRPEIKSREIDIAIEDHQLALDRSELRPQLEFFTGYEIYNERDPDLGREINHGYVVGVNARWHLFDGFATKGRMEATKARRNAARHALEATKLTAESEVRSAFLDLQQSDHILEAETKNVQTADESLEFAKGNLGAGLGTQLDVLQAASDVTRTRTTRLNAVYLHNVALARLARACGGESESPGFEQKVVHAADPKREHAESQMFEIARPPAMLNGRK
ncbi:MAG: TolC family protein, partial [Verrucomicrobiota bacterium]|nr:TolC family protein [Verrucomicrobiota bacterium]